MIWVLIDDLKYKPDEMIGHMSVRQGKTTMWLVPEFEAPEGDVRRVDHLDVPILVSTGNAYDGKRLIRHGISGGPVLEMTKDGVKAVTS